MIGTGDAADDLRERLDVLGRRQAHSDELAAGGRHRLDLPERRLGVAGGRTGHGLDDDRGSAPDGDSADADLSRAAHGTSLAAREAARRRACPQCLLREPASAPLADGLPLPLPRALRGVPSA